MLFLALIVLLVVLKLNVSISSYNDSQIMNVMKRCLMAPYHKVSAEEIPQNDLFSCSSWYRSSCCSKNIAQSIEKNGMIDLYNFTWDHCGNISSACKKYFIQDLCLYECSGILGGYIKSVVTPKYRISRYMYIPLCKSNCNQWWNACKDDFTCSDSWPLAGFDYSNGIGKCVGECKKFSEWYSTSEQFCEKLFKDSFKVTNDKCISLNPTTDNEYTSSFQTAYNASMVVLIKERHIRNLNITIVILVILSLILLFLIINNQISIIKICQGYIPSLPLRSKLANKNNTLSLQQFVQ